jgi:uncharacterized protein
LQAYLAGEDYSAVAQKIKENKSRIYGSKNAVLYYLDMGMTLHNAGEYKESDRNFDQAELWMDKYYTKSVSRGLGTFVINDKTKKYAGVPYERSLLYVFRALNYASQKDSEEAAVEARKLTGFLAQLRDTRKDKAKYKDDAFAQYLASMLYEDVGQYDDARISMEDSVRTYAEYAKNYGTSFPDFDIPENDLENNGEIVVLHYNGTLPDKVSDFFQVSWNDALIIARGSSEYARVANEFNSAIEAGIMGNVIKVAYPRFIDRGYSIKSSEVSVDGNRQRTRLVENVSQIAKKELDEKNASTQIRAIARATVKYVLAQKASKYAEKQGGATLGVLAKILTGVTAAATETADTRSWITLPAEIRMSRMAVSPGTHDVRMTFKDAFGNVVDTHTFENVKVEKGKRTYLHFRTAK